MQRSVLLPAVFSRSCSWSVACNSLYCRTFSSIAHSSVAKHYAAHGDSQAPCIRARKPNFHILQCVVASCHDPSYSSALESQPRVRFFLRQYQRCVDHAVGSRDTPMVSPCRVKPSFRRSCLFLPESFALLLAHRVYTRRSLYLAWRRSARMAESRAKVTLVLATVSSEHAFSLVRPGPKTTQRLRVPEAPG